MVCRECGCTDAFACQHDELGSCGWAEAELCTACVPDADPGWEHPPKFEEEQFEDANA